MKIFEEREYSIQREKQVEVIVEFKQAIKVCVILKVEAGWLAIGLDIGSRKKNP